MDTRLEALLAWLEADLGMPPETFAPASADASFRRYFRVLIGGTSYIVMDAPPPRENVRPFLSVAALLREAGVRTPEIHAADAERGFILLQDFGSRAYLDELNAASADRLYGAALETLLRLQGAAKVEDAPLPRYDERLLRTELSIFTEWFLQGLLGLEITTAERDGLDTAFADLVALALAQPQVCVHRDYHSRNLMAMDDGVPGVLDFQDAVVGPVTYDAVSLLRDCYVAWPEERVEGWLDGYRECLASAGLIGADGAAQFRRWFDWMGMQRHLKAIGIFSRLKLRDGKPGYLKDIPRTLAYVRGVAGAYPEFAGFLNFIDDRVEARWAEIKI